MFDIFGDLPPVSQMMRNTGWIHPIDLSREQQKAREVYLGSLPVIPIPSQVYGAWMDKIDRTYNGIMAVRVANCKKMPPLYQQVGSCVGHGFGNMDRFSQANNIYVRGMLGDFVLSYEPYAYAQSRVCAGFLGNSDGSTGSGMAEAAKRFGVLRADLEGLPRFRYDDTVIIFDGNVDRSWGYRGAPQKWVEIGQKSTTYDAQLITSADQARDWLKLGKIGTIAATWLPEDNPSIVEGVLLARTGGSGGHQQCLLDWYNHPTLGELFWIHNSWGNIYKRCPTGMPAGGYWVTRKTFEREIIPDHDSFMFSGPPLFQVDPLFTDFVVGGGFDQFLPEFN